MSSYSLEGEIGGMHPSIWDEETTLRQKVIERLAVELHDQAPDVIEENYAVAAEFILDAMLDCLTENQDETIFPKYNDGVTPWRIGDVPVEDLLEVLREDR